MATSTTLPTLPLSSILGIPIICTVSLPAIPITFPGLIALGPTRSERDILYNCCHTLDTQVFSVNDTACLQTAECKVRECSLNDPSYACVALQRESWKVGGAFACVKGFENGGGGKVSAGVGMMVAMGVLAVMGMGVL